MEVKTFTYKSVKGIYLCGFQTMDKHMEEMLSQGWEIVSQSAHSGNGRTFGFGAKLDSITVIFRRTR